MARSGMSNILLRLRGMVDAGSADYTVNSVSYWTDNHLQDILDQNRTDIYWRDLTAQGENNGGTIVYHLYTSGLANLEEAASGTAIWIVQDVDGADAGTANYTPDYVRGEIRFAADTGGSSYFLTARSYNLNAAAAEVWRRKAAHFVSAVDFSTDNHTISRGQMRTAALEMADYYERGGAVSSSFIGRSDDV